MKRALPGPEAMDAARPDSPGSGLPFALSLDGGALHEHPPGQLQARTPRELQERLPASASKRSRGVQASFLGLGASTAPQDLEPSQQPLLPLHLAHSPVPAATSQPPAQAPAQAATAQPPAYYPGHILAQPPAQPSAQAGTVSDALHATFTAASEQAFGSVSAAMSYLQSLSSHPLPKGVPGTGPGAEAGREAAAEAEADAEARLGASRALGSLVAAQQGLMKMVDLWEFSVRNGKHSYNHAISRGLLVSRTPLEEQHERTQLSLAVAAGLEQGAHAKTPGLSLEKGSLAVAPPHRTQSCGINSASDEGAAHEAPGGLRGGHHAGEVLSMARNLDTRAQPSLGAYVQTQTSDAVQAPTPPSRSTTNSSSVTASSLQPAQDILAQFANRIATQAWTQPTLALEGSLGHPGSLGIAGGFGNVGGTMVPRLSGVPLANPLAIALEANPGLTPPRASASHLMAALLASASRGPSSTSEAFLSRVSTAASASPTSQLPVPLGAEGSGLRRVSTSQREEKPLAERPRTAEGLGSLLWPAETGNAAAAPAADAGPKRLSPGPTGESAKPHGEAQGAQTDAEARADGKACLAPSTDAALGPTSSKVVLEVESDGPVLEPSHDGYHWRRYGRKYIKDQQFPRYSDSQNRPWSKSLLGGRSCRFATLRPATDFWEWVRFPRHCIGP